MNLSKIYSIVLLVSLTLVLYSCDSMTDSAPQNNIQSQGLTVDSNAKKAKVDVCHLDDEGNYRLISIAEPALKGHTKHGDAQPGDAVPGRPGFVFDEACTQVSVCFEGVFEGSFNQTDQPEVSVTVTFSGCVEPGQKIADVAYSGPYICSGDWILVEDTNSGLMVEEVNMTSPCLNNVGIALEYDVATGSLNGETVTISGNSIPIGLFGTYDDLQQIP
jgi:hypothetical protein